VILGEVVGEVFSIWGASVRGIDLIFWLIIHKYRMSIVFDLRCFTVLLDILVVYVLSIWMGVSSCRWPSS